LDPYIYIIQRQKNSPRNGESGFPRPKKLKTQKSSHKVLASVSWDKDRILLVDYLERGATITFKYSVALLDEFKQQLAFKHRGKLSKGILFIKDNSAPHKVAITHQKLTELKHLAYPPDLAPLDNCLFPDPKKHFKGNMFF
jgi:hypothetical protein